MKFCLQLSILVILLLEAATSRSEKRIIGGSNAPAGIFPFAAAIYVQNSDSRYFCGGSLIDHQWILTSGHCVNEAVLFTIQLGSNTLSISDSNRQILSSMEYIIHPDFGSENIQNDIALIRLRISISYNTYIQPINLPPLSLLNQTEVTAIGWGQTSDFDANLSEHLQYLKAKILSNAECRQIYGDQITDNMACVIGNYNEGTCTGDSGSPLVEYFNRNYWVVGIASFISGNGCESTDPSGYTRTYPYTDWIKSILNNKM